MNSTHAQDHLLTLAQGSEPMARRNKKEICRFHATSNLLMILTLVGIALGFALGFVVREFKPSDDAIMWIGMPGDLYMRLLTLCIVPLTTCTVISGAARLDPKTNGKVGLVSLMLIVLTHIIAVSVSLAMYLIIRPGAKSTEIKEIKLGIPVASHDIFADLLRNLIPDNMVTATFRQTVTKYEIDDEASRRYALVQNLTRPLINDTNSTVELAKAVQVYKRVVTSVDSINVLGLITVSCVFGVAAGKLKTKVSAFLTFFNHATEVVFLVMGWFVWFTPLGVISLIGQSISQIDDVTTTFSDLGLFVVTTIVAILIHWLVSLPVLQFVIVRKSPLPVLIHSLRPASISFAAAYSAITLPEMMTVCEHKLAVDKRVVHTALPLTLTLNADGSSIFITVACMFVARYTGFDMSADRVLIVGILTVMSCLAIPAVPSASIVTIVIIMSAMNIPIHNVALLFAVEWLLDRTRTALNCVSNIFITVMVNRICRQTLKDMDEKNREMTSLESAANGNAQNHVA